MAKSFKNWKDRLKEYFNKDQSTLLVPIYLVAQYLSVKLDIITPDETDACKKRSSSMAIPTCKTPLAVRKKIRSPG